MESLTRNSSVVPTVSGTNRPSENRWKAELKSAFRNAQSLFHFLELDEGDFSDLVEPSRTFPILVTQSFASRMNKGDPRDPLLLQVIQLATQSSSDPSDLDTVGLHSNHQHSNELGVPTEEDWNDDPVGDQNAQAIPGLLHKYRGRVLLVATGACAIHCRYCFRQHFDYSQSITGGNFDAAIKYITANESIFEVILSGGDPLMLIDSNIEKLVEALDSVPHVEHLRIHTRLPIVLPSRITDELVTVLTSSQLVTRLVVHINHPNEISSDVLAAIAKLQNAGISVLNQTVLLNGINETFGVQYRLARTLIRNNIAPYYLHLLDKVKGAENFLVAKQHALHLMDQLQSSLPGFAVPKLVEEIAGHPCKKHIHFAQND